MATKFYRVDVSQPGSWGSRPFRTLEAAQAYAEAVRKADAIETNWLRKVKRIVVREVIGAAA